MSNSKKWALSLNGETFNAFKSDFDQMLRKLLTEMEKREGEEATINAKIVVSLTKDQERDFECNGYDGMKDIVKPAFKHEISTVMQVKNKKSGSLGGNMKLVWDRELCQYVMQEIDNGQTTLFDEDGEEPSNPEKVVYALPEGEAPDDAIDAEYTVVPDEGEEQNEGEKDESAGGQEIQESPFEYMKQFIEAELRVLTAGNISTVRTAENKVVLSSGFPEDSPFYCPEEKLKHHVGHSVVCVGYGHDDDIVNISVECEECNEVLFDISGPEEEGDEPLPEYEYDEPADEQAEA